MLPVSGAWQLIASGASSLLQPDSSAIGAYSSWVSPDSAGRNRFHSPRSRAFAFELLDHRRHRVVLSGRAPMLVVLASAGSTCSRMKSSMRS